jgi:hypothetical protein
MRNMRILLAIVLCYSTGCVGIFRGTTQGVWLLSDPAGATVVLDEQTGVTPCFFALDRGSGTVMVRYELDGHAPVQQPVTSRCNGGLLVMSFLNNPFSIIGDAAMGNAHEWPYALNAKMAPAGGMSVVTETRILPLTPEQVRQRERERESQR